MRAAFKVLWPFALVMVLSLIAISALAQDKPAGSWWDDPRVRSCCGLGDAVYADQWTILADGSVMATVTGGSQQVASWIESVIGKTYHVPADKVIDVPGNPTGRALLFISPHTHGVWCFAYGPMI